MADMFHVVLTTCPNQENAELIARRLVEDKLAACVNVIPGVRSYYEWQGRLEASDELLLVIKSRADAFAALQKAIVSAHPYELPEIIAVPLSAGSDRYLAWLDANVRPTP